MNELSIQTWKITVSPSTLTLQIEPVFFDDPNITLDLISSQIPGGAYTTFRTYSRTRVFFLAQHFERLEESARLAGFAIQVQWNVVRDYLRSIVEASPLPELRCRITLDLTQQPGDIYISVEPLHIPSRSDYEQGVIVMTEKMQRQNPLAKLTNFISVAAQTRQSRPAGIHEVLMVDSDENLLEGLSSNFFGVKNRVLHTAHEGVLFGMMRSLVLEVARDLNISVSETALSIDDLASLEEAFITSASRGVLPVTTIQPYVIGTGKPGPITLKIRERFGQNLQTRLEEI